MPGFVSFTERDLLRGKIVTPAWYRMHIEGYEEKLSSKGDSTNYVIEGTILFNAEDNSEEYKGVPIVWNFNSKAMGFMLGFFAAMGVVPNPGERINLDAMIGQNIDVYVENDTYEGRTINRVNHKYRAPQQ